MSDFSPILVLQFKASINRNKTWQDTNKIRKTHTKHCNRQRKALQPPTQSIATANAKHCICQRKALHLPTQSIASANAKHCNRQRKCLWEKAPSFSNPFPCFSTEPILVVLCANIQNFMIRAKIYREIWSKKSQEGKAS